MHDVDKGGCAKRPIGEVESDFCLPWMATQSANADSWSAKIDVIMERDQTQLDKRDEVFVAQRWLHEEVKMEGRQSNSGSGVGALWQMHRIESLMSWSRCCRGLSVIKIR